MHNLNFSRLTRRVLFAFLVFASMFTFNGCTVVDEFKLKGTWKFNSTIEGEDLTIAIYGETTYHLSNSFQRTFVTSGNMSVIGTFFIFPIKKEINRIKTKGTWDIIEENGIKWLEMRTTSDNVREKVAEQFGNQLDDFLDEAEKRSQYSAPDKILSFGENIMVTESDTGTKTHYTRISD